jgi:ABC-type multidrug transport system fused ATPase/permease subunit
LNHPAPAPEASNWQLTRRLLAMTWRYRWGCIKVLAVQVALLVFALSGIGFTGLGIDEIRHALDPSAPEPRWPFHLAPPADWPPMRVVAAIALAVFAFAALRAVCNNLNTVWFAELLQGRLVVDLRAAVYDRLQRLSFRFFDANASSSLINRVSDVQSVRLFIDGVVMPVVVMIISVAAYLAYMLAIHVKLTLACLAATPLLWMVSSSFSRTVRPAYKRTSDLFDAMVERLSESIRGVQVVKAFAREPGEIERFEKANDTLRDQQHWIFWRVSSFVPVILFLSQTNLIVLLGYGGWLSMRGEISVGTGLVSFAAILQQFAAQIAGIGNIANSMQQCLRAARRVFEVLDAPVQIESPRNPVRPPRIEGRVRFEKVWFDHGRDPVLQDIDFEAKPGQCVAIVGPTGSGKSALMSLVPRFYDPASGRVLIDEIDARDLDLDQLRRSVGLVFQESFLFSTTIAANIAFGHPEASREQIEKAARIAAAHEFITALPNGYDTILGEAGIGLSGGQKQRLAIARALLPEPAILLLDDPTASVDPGTEHEIVEAMEAAMAGRTTFLVAHRPSMLRRADLVIVIDRGRIVQIGTHGELMRATGYYARSAEAQLVGEKEMTNDE